MFNQIAAYVCNNKIILLIMLISIERRAKLCHTFYSWLIRGKASIAKLRYTKYKIIAYLKSDIKHNKQTRDNF